MSTDVASRPPDSAPQAPAAIVQSTPTLDHIIEGLAWLILGLAPLFINVYNVDAYRTIQAAYSSLFIVAIAATWAISVTLTGRWREVSSMPFVGPLSVFAIWALGTFLVSTTSIPVSGASWINLVLYSVFFLVVADMGARKRAFLWRLAIPIFFAFSFNCVTGLMQHKALLFLGSEASAYTGLYQYWPIKSTAIANYFAGLQAPSRLHSAAGTLGNQNVLGGYLSVLIPLFSVLPIVVFISWRNLVDSLLRRYKQMAEGTANTLVAVLAGFLSSNAMIAFAALLATDTRGAWLGVAASLVLAIGITPAFFKDQLSQIGKGTWVRIVIGGMVGLILMGGLAVSAGVTPKMLQDKVMNTWTIKQRLVAWQVAKEMADEKPIIGQGLGTYKIHYFKYLAKSFDGKPIPTYMHHRYVQAHNDIIQLAGESGYVGLLLGMGILGAFWLAILNYIWRRRPPSQEGLLLLGVVLGMAGMTVFAVSGFPFHIAASSTAFTALAGMAGASLWSEKRAALPPSQAPSALPLEARWALAGALTVFAVSLMAFIYMPFKSDELTKEGMELYKSGQVVESAKKLEQAIHLDPERGDARLVLGITLAMMNKFSESEAQLKRSQTSYDDVTLHYYLGRVYEAQKKTAEARGEYLKALSYFPEGTDVRKVVNERLQALDGKVPASSSVPASGVAAVKAAT